MKILQVNPFFSPVHGGSAQSSYEISKWLSQNGHNVTLYTSDFRLSREWVKTLHQVKVYPFKTQLYWASFFITLGILKKARNEIRQFDVVHMHNYRSFQNIIVAYYARKYGIPYVLQAHGSLDRIMAKQKLKLIYDLFFGNRLLRHASKVIACTQAEAQQYQRMGVTKEKIEIIPNGIDTLKYSHLPPESFFKKKFNIQDNKKIILYLGRIHKQKGIDFLIKTYAHLVKTMRCNNTVLVVAGPNDGYLNEAKSLVSSLGISDLVLFTGILSEEDKIIAYVGSEICAYLNPLEPFGIVPLETAACGTPVIVSQNTYMDKIVNNGKFGFSVNYGDVYELEKVINKMLSDDSLLHELGQNGREYVFRNYDWADIITKFEKVYEEVL